jgi:hypothetical protein
MHMHGPYDAGKIIKFFLDYKVKYKDQENWSTYITNTEERKLLLENCEIQCT